MNHHSMQENNHCDRGCHTVVQQLAQQHQFLAVGRVAGWLGFSLLSFMAFLFVMGRIWPNLNSVAGQGVLALLSLGATGVTMVTARKCIQVWWSIRSNVE